MADYYLILKRAVDSLPDGSRERRQAIYDKARKALLAQLQNMDPPLAPSEISKQRMSLEEAVRVVERDLSLETEQSAASPEGDESPKSAPDEVSKSAAETARSSSGGPTPPQVAAPAVTIIAPDRDGSGSSSHGAVASEQPSITRDENDTSSSDKVVRRAGQDVLKNAVRDANALGAATNASVKSAQDAGDAVAQKRDNDVARIEPTLGDTLVSNAKTYQRTVASNDIPSSHRTDSALDEDAEPKGRFGMIAGVLLLAGVLGGSGYLLYENRGSFMGSDNDAGEGTLSSDAQTTANEPASQASDPDAGDQATGEDQEIKSKPVRTVTVTAPGSSPAGDTAAETTKNKPAAQVSEKPDAAVSVAQRSILYEEEGPNGEPGAASVGEVLWTLEGEAADPTIVMTAKIPEQGLTFTIKIGKNSDPELPASHLIEISSVRDNPDIDKAISNIPGLILKPTEQSRGEGLVGAAMRIADDFHWIALTAGEREVQYNMELLSLRSWIDIPIQYTTGRRGILTLEKGVTGERVVDEAIKAWSE
ncbi:hypothetical protein [Cohaesibacter celericrescens]|uniref:CheA signal transduction histidine kinase n=1 Tax=Cohaesibacter celericrescens TaxID=2067669 RepID=A0A2N5XLA3_9HYPH|nr:hypothetical protein [Cohaesibacter celericrescens]PLW75207.1 hypothetical protein C0081_20525 [Cohaesibacter celericrescens]